MALHKYQIDKLALWQLQQRQGLDLRTKIKLTMRRIDDWYKAWDGDVYVAFSGGKDSTVLLDLVRSEYSDVPAVFADTGLEFPEIKNFVKEFDDVTTLRPDMNFKEVIDTKGYPIISKQFAFKIKRIRRNPDCYSSKYFLTGYKSDGVYSSYGKIPEKWRYLLNAPFKISDECCDVMKKIPFKKYEKKTGRKGFIGTMALDSQQRRLNYLKVGCNSFVKYKEKSQPLGFWNTQDIWQYIKHQELNYCSIYGCGIKNTGCIFCMFGVHLEKYPNRFQILQDTHPQIHNYCMTKLGLKKILDYIHVDGYKPKTLNGGTNFTKSSADDFPTEDIIIAKSNKILSDFTSDEPPSESLRTFANAKGT